MTESSLRVVVVLEAPPSPAPAVWAEAWSAVLEQAIWPITCPPWEARKMQEAPKRYAIGWADG
jgi:hypothetical protein